MASDHAFRREKSSAAMKAFVPTVLKCLGPGFEWWSKNRRKNRQWVPSKLQVKHTHTER